MWYINSLREVTRQANWPIDLVETIMDYMLILLSTHIMLNLFMFLLIWACILLTAYFIVMQYILYYSVH